jgi:hypothetical protein
MENKVKRRNIVDGTSCSATQALILGRDHYGREPGDGKVGYTASLRVRRQLLPFVSKQTPSSIGIASLQPPRQCDVLLLACAAILNLPV